MEHCVASNIMFLPLTGRSTLLLSLVENFALEQAWWLMSKRVSQTRPLTIQGDFLKVAFSLKFYLPMQYATKMHIIMSQRKMAK